MNLGSPIPPIKGWDGSDSEIVYPVLYRFGDSRYQKNCDRGLPAVSGPFWKENRSERIKADRGSDKANYLRINESC